MQKLILTTLIATIATLSPFVSYAGVNKNCTDLVTSLQTCTPFSCSYERKATSESETTSTATYEILGPSEGDTCGYKMSLGEETLFNCKFTKPSIDAFGRIIEMQLDGSFQKQQQNLADAINSRNSELMSQVDPDFIKLNKKFAYIYTSQCNR